MRAPFQILAIPYRIHNGIPLFCVLHRADFDQWQFVAGGGEDTETPIEAAKREVSEETGIITDNIIHLISMSYIPANIFPDCYRQNWPADTFVLPEYSFAFRCDSDIVLSNEHTECAWMTYDEAHKTLKWDSNRTALYELKCRLGSQT